MHTLDEIRRLLPADLEIPAGELTQLESSLTLLRLEKADHLLNPGEVCGLEGVVTRGCLRVYFTEPDGSERVIYFAPEGWYVTDIESLIRGRPTALGIDALERTDVWVLDEASRQSADARFPAWNRILRALAETVLVAFQKRLVGGMRKTAAERYLNFQRLYPGLDLRIPQYHIAAYLGISPEFLSKLRKRLIREDYLSLRA